MYGIIRTDCFQTDIDKWISSVHNSSQQYAYDTIIISRNQHSRCVALVANASLEICREDTHARDAVEIHSIISLLEMEICDNCKEGKMILSGFSKAKTVCTNCWERFTQPVEGVLAGDDAFLTEFPDPVILQNLSTLATSAMNFLARDQYYYPWGLIRRSIVNGYRTYQHVHSLFFGNNL